jgi:methionine aminotransferase
MVQFNSKLPHVGMSIFTVMSKMASDYGAINLSQGFPNFQVDTLLTQLFASQVHDNLHQYAPMPGNTDLLLEIAGLIERQYNRTVDATSEILVTAGATQAIFTAIQTLIHPGEEVIIVDPCYDCYDPAVILAGGTPVHVPLSDDFMPDWNRIEAAISSKTRLLILNNPHNPTGKVLDLKEMEDLELLLSKYPTIFLLSDEVYEFITFEKKHISIHTREALRNRALIVSSFGKTFHITGWKVGYLVAPEKLLNEIKKVHQYMVFSVNSPAQAVLASYLKQKDVTSLGHFYQEKRTLFQTLMKQSRFRLLPSEGTYFQVASYEDITTERDLDFCKRLVTQYGVAAIPLSVFNENRNDRQLIRFCFAKTNETLIQATEKLCKI